MQFFSTRDQNRKVTSSEAIAQGLSNEGGLFVLEHGKRNDFSQHPRFVALATARQIAEHISTHGECLLGLQLVDEAAYEAKVKRIVLYRHHMATSPAEQFERDAAGAREEVQCRGSLIEINITLQDIEEIFLCKVRRGTGLEGAGDVETASLVFSSDYAHTSTCSI